MLVCSIIIGADPSFSEEFEFDMAEFEKKPYSLGGYLELTPVFQGIDRESLIYKIKFPDGNEDDTEGEYKAGVLLDMSLQKGMVELFLQTSVNYTDSYRGV